MPRLANPPRLIVFILTPQTVMLDVTGPLQAFHEALAPLYAREGWRNPQANGKDPDRRSLMTRKNFDPVFLKFLNNPVFNQAAIEIIAFEIGGQQFCVRTTAVREIRGWSKSTPLPGSPHEVMGMMNLRGSIIPIVNMASKLGMAPSEPDARSAVIVAEVQSAVIGLLVDRVADILTVEAKLVQPTPEMRGSFTGGYVTGVAIDGANHRAILSVWDGFAIVDLTSRTVTRHIAAPPAPLIVGHASQVIHGADNILGASLHPDHRRS